MGAEQNGNKSDENEMAKCQWNLIKSMLKIGS
jgi:hypothetical protein